MSFFDPLGKTNREERIQNLPMLRKLRQKFTNYASFVVIVNASRNKTNQYCKDMSVFSKLSSNVKYKYIGGV